MRYFEEIISVDGFEARLKCYLLDNSPEIEGDRLHPAVLIFPGGGYQFVSDREGEPVALKFLAEGYNAYILKYSVRKTSDARFPVQLNQAFKAIKYIRENAATHYTDPDKVLVCGFSAGGHLAASTGCLCSDESLRPNGMILSYAVLEYHKGSFENLTGRTEGAYDDVNMVLKVNASTPPTFLWHTADDKVVDVSNSKNFAAALKAHNVPHKLIIYKSGVHGLSLCSHLTASPKNPQYINKKAECWFGECLDFFSKL